MNELKIKKQIYYCFLVYLSYITLIWFLMFKFPNILRYYEYN